MQANLLSEMSHGRWLCMQSCSCVWLTRKKASPFSRAEPVCHLTRRPRASLIVPLFAAYLYRGLDRIPLWLMIGLSFMLIHEQ